MRHLDYNAYINPDKKPQQTAYTQEQITEHEWLSYQEEVLGRKGLPASDIDFRGDFS